MKINRPQLTISLLVSNRLDTIPRCLDSLRPIMEAIACELILIDTSKNAEVHNLLLEYTDQVYEFEWCQDFAKARNEGLSRATGEWFLYLDDDEWFVETDPIIEFFQSGEYKKYGYANYQIRNFLDEEYIHYNDCWVSRMVRVGGDTRFVSKIHEYFAPIKGEQKNLHAMVYHSGYIYETTEKKRAHFERNRTLLLDMIKNEPNSIRWRLQLAQEYSSAGEWEDLIACCAECLSVMADINTEYMCNHIGTFYTGLTTGLLRQKKYEESISACKQALTDERCREILRAMMHLRLGENYLYLGQYDEVLEEVTEYLQMSNVIDGDAPSIFEQNAALLVGDVFNKSNKKIAYNLLIWSQLEKGEVKPLVEHYDRLEWSEGRIFTIENVEKYMVKAIWTIPYQPIFTRIIMDVFCNKELRAQFCKEILVQDVCEDNNFQMILYSFAEARKSVVDGPNSSDMLGYYNSLQKYVQVTCQWYDYLGAQGMLARMGEKIPGYIQAAIGISDYIELESQNTIEALGKLKDAVENVPEFAEGIGKFLHSYEELDNQRAESQSKEMETLRVQVISQIETMLAAGQIQAATQIIGQLKQMFPGDAEIEALDADIKC